jgi:hypothetical protein
LDCFGGSEEESEGVEKEEETEVEREEEDSREERENEEGERGSEVVEAEVEVGEGEGNEDKEWIPKYFWKRSLRTPSRGEPIAPPISKRTVRRAALSRS